MDDVNELVKIVERIDTRSNSEHIDKKIENKIKELLADGHSLRETASIVGTTYYQVHKVYSAAWTTVVIHYRTIRLNGYDFQLRMLPYDMTEGMSEDRLTLKEAQKAVEDGKPLRHAIEIRMGNSLWLDFDGAEILGAREHQLDFFYNKLTLADFATSVSLSLDFALTAKSLDMLVVFFSFVLERNPELWTSVKGLMRHPLRQELVARVETLGNE